MFPWWCGEFFRDLARLPAGSHRSRICFDDEPGASGLLAAEARRAPDAATLLQAVAAADPAKYPSVASQRESKHWSNPYLVIRPDAVGLLTAWQPTKNRL